NRRIRANAERERQYRDNRECRRLAKHARAVAQILPERLEDSEAVHLENFLANFGSITKLTQGGEAGFVRRHAARDVVVRFDLEIVFHFASALFVPVRAAEEFRPSHLLTPWPGSGLFRWR